MGKVNDVELYKNENNSKSSPKDNAIINKEMNKEAEMKGYKYGIVVTAVVSIFIMIYNLFFGNDSGVSHVVGTIILGYVSADALAKFLVIKKKIYLVIIIFGGFACIMSLINYILTTI